MVASEGSFGFLCNNYMTLGLSEWWDVGKQYILKVNIAAVGILRCMF